MKSRNLKSLFTHEILEFKTSVAPLTLVYNLELWEETCRCVSLNTGRAAWIALHTYCGSPVLRRAETIVDDKWEWPGRCRLALACSLLRPLATAQGAYSNKGEHSKAVFVWHNVRIGQQDFDSSLTCIFSVSRLEVSHLRKPPCPCSLALTFMANSCNRLENFDRLNLWIPRQRKKKKF